MYSQQQKLMQSKFKATTVHMCMLHSSICGGVALQDSQYECPFCVMMRKGGCEEVFKVCAL